MIKTNVMKNQKEQKMRKMHMRSILSEVKNKSIMEELQREGFNFIINLQNLLQDQFSPGQKTASQNRHHKFKDFSTSDQRIVRKTSNSKKNKVTSHEKDEANISKNNEHDKENVKQNTKTACLKPEGLKFVLCHQAKTEEQPDWSQRQQIIPKQQESLFLQDSKQSSQSSLPKNLKQNNRKLKLQRKSSIMQSKLQEIVKYSLLYPSAQNSQKKISESLKKMKLSKSFQLRQNNQKSRFSHRIQGGQTINQHGNKQNHKPRFFQSNSKFNKNLTLQLVDFHDFQIVQKDASQQKQVKHLLKKSKQAINNMNNHGGYSFQKIIQNHHNDLKFKRARQTVSTSPTGEMSLQDQQLQMEEGDVRLQNMYDIHRFLRGDDRECEQIDPYITTKEMAKFQNKFGVYQNIYKKAKEGFNNEKVDLNAMGELTVRNAVYLNEALQQSNNRAERRGIEKAMKKIRFYN